MSRLYASWVRGDAPCSRLRKSVKSRSMNARPTVGSIDAGIRSSLIPGFICGRNTPATGATINWTTNKAADSQVESLAATLGSAFQAMLSAMGKFAELSKQLGTNWHRKLSRRGWGWCAEIGGMIDQSRICLMSNRRDHGNRRLGCRPDHLFLIERPKILNRSAAAHENPLLVRM